MSFQYHVYTVLHKNTGCTLGCFPNFGQAYERIEELAEGSTIIDCGDMSDGSIFDVINIEKHGRYTRIYTERYVVYENLLTIFDDDKLVSPFMLCKLKKENRKRNRNSQYKLNTEVI